MKPLKVHFSHSIISFLIYYNLLVLTVELNTLAVVIATSTTTPAEYGSGNFTKPKRTTDAFETERDSSSSSTSEYVTPTTKNTPEPEQLPPEVKFEQEIDILKNSFSDTNDTIELEYTTETNPITKKEQRIILANLSTYEPDYRCYILTCTAQYPVKWVTSIPYEGQSSVPRENEECRFGDQWVYSIWKRDDGVPDKGIPKNQVDLDGSYKIRFSFRMTKGGSGRIKCQSMTNQSLFTDYYVYTNAGPVFVNYDGNANNSILELFWEIPPVVEAVLFNFDNGGNIYNNINYFFEDKIYLQPEFSVLNNSYLVIPLPSNYPSYYDWFNPRLYQQGAKGDPLEYDKYCFVPVDYVYEPSIGFIFDDFNFIKTYFLPDCVFGQFLLKKVEFSNFDDAAFVNVHVTGNSTEKIEFTRAFLNILPPNAEKDVDYNYLLGKGDGIENQQFRILPCNFPSECEILKPTLNRYLPRNQDEQRKKHVAYESGNSTNNSLVSGLIRNFKYNGMLPSYEFFFTGLGLENGSPRRYLLSDDIPKDAVITLKHILPTSPTVGLSDQKQFRCEISNFVLINNIKMYKYGTKSLNTNNKTGIEVIETFELLNPSENTDSDEEGWYSWDGLAEMEGFNSDYGSTYLDIFVDITESDSEIICTAPWQNSTDLITETIDIRLPKINKMLRNDNGQFTISYKKGEPIPSIVCSASGAPELSVSWVLPKCELRAQLNEITVGIGESRLEFLPPFEDNDKFQGEYTCEVKNDYGSDTLTATLVIEPEEETQNNWWMWWELIASLIVPPVIIFIITVCVRRHRYLTTEQRDLTEEEIQEFLHGQPQSQLSETSVTSDSSSSGFGSISENDALNHSSCYNSNVDVSVLPLHPQFIIPEDALTIEKTAKLGEGHFGIVYRGRVNEVAVAVKSTKEYADVSCVKAFMEEIKIMAYIAQEEAGTKQGNENIVNFIGVVIDRLRERLVYAVVELSPIGNLQSYLETIRERRTPEYNNLLVNDQFITYISAGLKTPFAFTQYKPKIITTIDLVHWCGQIAAGMNYLSSKRVIHGDLATRNVLVFPHNVVKITDFGLSKKLYAYSQYVRNKDKKVALPWAWMALECLQHNTFSTESDIWSFGVTIWEIFSMGQFPYPGYNFSNNFVSALSSGMRMGKPSFASSTIYNQMWNCWNSSSKNRPSFAQLRGFFEAIVQEWIADVEVGQEGQNTKRRVKKEIAVYIHKDYV